MLVIDWIKQFFGLGNNFHKQDFESMDVETAIQTAVQPISTAETTAVRKTADELSQMTKKQLEEYAKSIGVEVDIKKTKANIIDSLL